MAEEGWFDDIRSVGELAPDEYIGYLLEVDDPSVEGLTVEEAVRQRGFLGFGEKKPFEHTGSQVGYIEAGPGRYLSIVDPRNVEPARNLAGKRVTVTLTQALVVQYPGRGVHQILVHLEAGDRKMDGARYQFSSTVRTADADTPAVVGQVLFSGLPVDGSGLSIRLKTVNVCSEDDEKLLSAMQSQVYQMGLDLVSSGGPVIALLSSALGSIASSIAGRAKNRPVQDGLVAVGLDRKLVDAPKLRLGTYVLVQAPAKLEHTLWTWSDYRYDSDNGVIVDSVSTYRPIGYNYFALGITESR